MNTIRELEEAIFEQTLDDDDLFAEEVAAAARMDEAAKRKKKRDGQDVEVLVGFERRYALDTAALLGGNEYFISQMLEKLSQTSYTSEEVSALQWAIGKLCGEREAADSFERHLLGEGAAGRRRLNQGHLTKYFDEDNQIRMPRILASALLYSGRYDDTELLQNKDNPTHRMIVINMRHYPQVELPVATIPSGKERFQDCHRIALLYFRARDRDDNTAGGGSSRMSKPSTTLTPPPSSSPTAMATSPARKISASLALERKMLSVVNVFACLPVP